MPRRLRVHRTIVVGLLLPLAMALQGCTVIAWLGAVGVDMTRTSDIVFQPFEHSWVGARQERQHAASMKSITVTPFAGDPMMAERWAAVFRTMTDLDVMGPSNATRHGVPPHGQIGSAREMSIGPRVDCVLTGNVTGQVSQQSFAGLKDRTSHRLYLQLVSDSGILMWKTELPYTIEAGAKDLDEEVVTQALLAHVKIHANELGFTELEMFNKRTIQ